MKNRALALTASSVPYIKELRSVAGSIASCIVMQQLDFWFARFPEGFYKFMEAAPGHTRFMHGQSWCEELNVSPDEFRTAFDKIGVRYTSKSQFDKAAQDGDVFQGRYYASYHDKIKGLTYYFRNHTVVDAALDALFTSQPQAPISVTGKSHLQESVPGENQPRNWQNPVTEMVDASYVPGNSQFNRGTETTTENTQETTTETTPVRSSSEEKLSPDERLLAKADTLSAEQFIAEVLVVYPHWRTKLVLVLGDPKIRSRDRVAVATLKNWLSGDGRPEPPRQTKYYQPTGPALPSRFAMRKQREKEGGQS